MFSITGVLTAFDDAIAAVRAVDWDALPIDELFTALDHFETSVRRATATGLELTAAVARRPDTELGAPASQLVADIIRVTPAQAKQRLRDSAELHPRHTLTGEPLPPVLPATATAWNNGLLDHAHLAVIQRFLDALPDHLDAATAASAESFLAAKAAELRPDQLRKLADALALQLNPDGDYSDRDRARQRGFTWKAQLPNGMSEAVLVATPELRATIEALLAKFAAPGMCNPDDENPVLDGGETPDAADRDHRTHRQRQHDALLALLRNQLGNPALGTHRGLPVTLIVTAKIEQLTAAAGWATTATGTRIPIPELLRLATPAYHYLCIFEEHTECPLYLARSRRTASPDQRLAVHAADRGCTFPNCDRPGYLNQIHHVQEWSRGGKTDIDNLTFACELHHHLLTPGGWTTRKLPDGRTEWTPPPNYPLPGGTNDFHHPERMLPQRD